jgi:hypothetical protein
MFVSIQAQGFRFPGFAAHYQDYEPSLDHFGFMRTGAGKNASFKAIFILKLINLPRQARNKHREVAKKSEAPAFSAQA